MKKYLFLAASAALVLGACSKTVVDTPEGTPVTFGVYAGNTATKATTGDLTTATLQSSTDGFGVFAYHSDASAGETAYTTGTSKPNFMYNQQVTYASSAWTYAPIKYWPNEYGSAATSTATDVVSFFAYAPYSDGSINGISTMTPANDAAGDPKILFTNPAAANVDLLWADQKASTLKNLSKQTTSGSVDFKFKHALSKVGFSIIAYTDAAAPSTSVIDATTTKIVVKSITLKTNSFASATLNLNNTAENTPIWETSGSAAAANYALDLTSDTDIYVSAAPTAFPSIAGVTETAATLTSSYFLIPTSSVTGVEIDYFVVTEDAKLAGGVSVVENQISKTLATALTLQAAYKYTIGIQLGMTTVKLTADVTGTWTDASSTTIDLPTNL